MNGDHGDQGISKPTRGPIVKKMDNLVNKTPAPFSVERHGCERHPHYNPELAQPPWLPGLGQSVCKTCWRAYYKVQFPHEPCGRSLAQCPYNKGDHLGYFYAHDEYGNPIRTHENIRKVKIVWTCSNYAAHQHRWKWAARLCGKLQKWGILNYGNSRNP